MREKAQAPCLRTRRGSQVFSKCFLRLDVNIAMALVEGVSALADDIGPDGHSLAFLAACPHFRGIEEFCTSAEAAVTFRDDEAIYFGAAGDFQKRRDTDVDPAEDGFFKLRNKNSVSSCSLDLTETLSHFMNDGGVTKLAAQFRDA